MVTREEVRKFYEKYKDALHFMAETVLSQKGVRFDFSVREDLLRIVDLSLKRIKKEKRKAWQEIVAAPFLFFIVLIKFIALLTVLVCVLFLLFSFLGLPQSYYDFVMKLYNTFTPEVLHGIISVKEDNFVPLFLSIVLLAVLSYVYPGEFLSVLLTGIDGVRRLKKLGFIKEQLKGIEEILKGKFTKSFILLLHALDQAFEDVITRNSEGAKYEVRREIEDDWGSYVWEDIYRREEEEYSNPAYPYGAWDDDN